MADGVREELLTECRGRQDLIRARARERGWTWAEPPLHARPASAAALGRAAATPGISLAPHSWSHPNLARATEAAGRVYWPSSAPNLRVPVDLVKATAWQESGWQSNIVACDGGIGLMQVMEETAGDVNERFEKNYDVHDYRDNATLGANYLAWLIKYFGDVYFDGDYTLDAGECADRTDACLLNAVIASYNVGFGNVDTDDGLVIPNPRYVENVRALMTECVCLSY